MAGLTDRRDEGGGRPRPNPWNRPQALTDRMGFPKRFELLVVIRPAFLQGAKLVSEWREKVVYLDLTDNSRAGKSGTIVSFHHGERRHRYDAEPVILPTLTGCSRVDVPHGACLVA
jgi:hypothetical protein